MILQESPKRFAKIHSSQFLVQDDEDYEYSDHEFTSKHHQDYASTLHADSFTRMSSMGCIETQDHTSILASAGDYQQECELEGLMTDIDETPEMTQSRCFAPTSTSKTCRNIRVSKLRERKVESSRLISAVAAAPQAMEFSLMRFQSKDRKKTFRIYCFNEDHLQIPSNFKSDIVNNESDDDKESDHEQVDRAVRYIHEQLLESVEEEKNN